MSETEHSSLGPSKWDRWVRCPGSVALSEGRPDIAGWEAAEGTAFHHLVATCLEHGLSPYDFIGEGNGCTVADWWFEYDMEMAESSLDGMHFVERFQEDPRWMVLVENKVDISPWAGEGQFGWADVIMWNVEARHIIVFDWKYGQGVPVHPDSSLQLRGYALGAWESFIREEFRRKGLAGVEYEDIRVDLVIEQPRIAMAGGTYTTSLHDVFETGRKAMESRRLISIIDESRLTPKEIQKATDFFNPGEKQCQFCPAQLDCVAYNDWMLRVIGAEFEDLDDVSFRNRRFERALTPHSRSAVLTMAPMIRKWLDKLHADAWHDAEMGFEVPGFKMVPGRRGRRKWRADVMSLARGRLVEQIGAVDSFVPAKLISPAQAEKLVGKREFHETFSDFVEQSEAKRVLVAETDSREAMPSIEDDFDNLDATEE